jgi:hypothetical protein
VLSGSRGETAKFKKRKRQHYMWRIYAENSCGVYGVSILQRRESYGITTS